VHDLAVYACPDTFALAQRWHLRALVPRAVARSARVIADSEHARGDLIRRFHVPPARVVAIPLGVPRAFQGGADGTEVVRFRSAHGLGADVIACIGTVQPRKHIERVVEAFVRSRVADLGWQLVIAGRVRPHYRPRWLDALPPRAKFLGPLSDAELRNLYATASIVVSASEYEGFGLTLLEAMANGCAVLAVATSSIPEVVGDAGVLVEASDAARLGDALAGLVPNFGQRMRLRAAAIERAAQFTWDETARRTRAVYEEAVACA
jgi:glycosyltransferase involved in cell wall biosynthesis